MNTDSFEIGARVRVNRPGHFLHGMPGTVTERDAYTVEVRFDEITPAMLDSNHPSNQKTTATK